MTDDPLLKYRMYTIGKWKEKDYEKFFETIEILSTDIAREIKTEMGTFIILGM